MVFIFRGQDTVINIVLELALEVNLVALEVSESAVGGPQEGLTSKQIPFSISVK